MFARNTNQFQNFALQRRYFIDITSDNQKKSQIKKQIEYAFFDQVLIYN